MVATIDLADVEVGSRIYFEEEKRPYRVRARSGRYLVCTKPHNPKKTVLYTVVDLVEQVRGTENLVFGFGAETDEECREMVDRLEGRGESDSEEDLAYLRTIIPDIKPAPPCKTEVSHRNRIPLRISRLTPAQP